MAHKLRRAACLVLLLLLGAIRSQDSPENCGVERGEDKVFLPKTLQEVKRLALAAKSSKLKVCLVGSGMSQNGQNYGKDGFIMVNLRGINGITLDSSEKTALVYGNITFRELEEAANKHALAIKVRQAAGIFGVLASISTNVHGWDHKSGCIGTTVRTIYALDSECNDLVIKRDTEEFKACVGSYGGMYLMYGAEIELTDNILLKKKVDAYSKFEEALAHFPAPEEDVDMALITVGSSKSYLVRFFPAERTPQVSKNLEFEGRVGPYIERLIIDIARFFEILRLKKIMEWFYENLIALDWTSSSEKLRNEFMNVNVNAIKKPFKGVIHRHELWLVEYFVKKEDLPALVEMFKAEYKDVFVFNAAVRFVKKYTETYSSYAETDVYALVICWDQKHSRKYLTRTRERNQRFLAFLQERGGKFYMAYKNNARDIVVFYPEFAKKMCREDSLYSNTMVELIKREARKFFSPLSLGKRKYPQ